MGHNSGRMVEKEMFEIWRLTGKRKMKLKRKQGNLMKRAVRCNERSWRGYVSEARAKGEKDAVIRSARGRKWGKREKKNSKEEMRE